MPPYRPSFSDPFFKILYQPQKSRQYFLLDDFVNSLHLSARLCTDIVRLLGEIRVGPLLHEGIKLIMRI